MKKRNIIITVATLVLAIALTLAMTACAPKGNELDETEVPTETVEATEAIEPVTEPTEAATEPTEVVTEAATEPTEATPEVTQPVITSKPSAGTNTSGNTPSNSSQTSNTTTTVTPTPTEPAATEPPVVTPSVTPTEPAPTEHTHNWQEVYHEEVSHEEEWITCDCYAKFSTLDQWIAHNKGVTGADVLNHTGYRYTYETVVDTPAYSTWVCACGATSDTQP